MKVIILSVVALLLTVVTYGQKVYQIRADSVRIYNVCDTAELILENRTQNVKGFLFNKGAGRTEFQKLKLQALGTSRIAILGQDTLDLSSLPGIGSGVDTIYTFTDSVKYIKQGKVYAFKAPAPFLYVPWGNENPFADYKDSTLTGFSAYASPDMPALSDQAQINQSAGNRYYVGHALRWGAYGYQMAVNWDGETYGPKGAFIRIKDDTKPSWGQWRELLFKDYADSKYALLSNSYTKTDLATPGAAQLAWGNIINVPTFAEQDNLESILTRGNRSLKPIGVHQVFSEGPPTISLAVGDYDSGINAVNDGTTTLVSNGFEVARWTYNLFNVKGNLTVNDNPVWHRGNDNLLLRDRGVITEANIDNVGGTNGTYRVEANGFSYNLLNFSNSGSTGTFQLLANFTGSLQYRNKTDEGVWNGWKSIWTDKNDGINSGLDADLLRGKASSPGAVASTIAERDANGYLFAQYFNTSAPTETASQPVKLFGSYDTYIRPYDANTVRNFLGMPATGETLQSVTDRGSATSKTITTGGINFNGNYGKFDGVHLDFHDGDNGNIRFWDGNDGYSIGMKSTASSGFPNVSTGADNDFNMYFQMKWNNRGFVFIPGNDQPQVQIDNTGLTVKDWIRVRGQAGLFFQDYGGGWNMIDNTWVRVYNNKSVYLGYGLTRTDGSLQVGESGGTLNVPAGGTPTIYGNTIFHAGNLLYSMTSTPNYLVQRDASGNVYANGFYQSSKASLKKNIVDFSESALPLINQVKIKQFVYKDDKEGHVHTGIIADSTDWHFSTKAHDKFDTNSSLAITMKAVQELSVQNQELKSQNNDLKSENDQLKKQMTDIIRRMEELEKKITK
ncbi:tail fiber domain-containing protein [Chitinophaga sp. Hz27]|uniref:tail fiber domain-containing protein n=1 Tax=Chitinophaga sp. Hz27 TaxID=3347169 RepID=UPI0035DFCA80